MRRGICAKKVHESGHAKRLRRAGQETIRSSQMQEREPVCAGAMMANILAGLFGRKR